MVQARVRGRTGLGIVGLFVAFAVAFSGCGAPAYTYVKNSGEHMYFRVPRSWHPVDQKALDLQDSRADPDSVTAKLMQQLVWSRAYDADAASSPAHMLIGDTEEPFVYGTVRRLTDPERDGVSLNTLRNFRLPVTETARQIVAQAGLPYEDFELLRDDVLTPRAGLKVVRVVFNYRLLGGTLETFDQTAYLNNDNTKEYVLLIRCTARCYHERAAELDAIAHSFTVRST